MDQQANYRIPTVKVEIQSKDKNGKDITIDLSQHGLTSLSFERYIQNPKNRASNILTDLDMTLYDNTGYNLLSYVQNAGGNLFIRYGFDDNMSPPYRITPTKYNVVQNNRGIMIGVGGYGLQNEYQVGAEFYKEKTNIKDLILSFVRRNGWFTNNGEYINIPENLLLPNGIYRVDGISDWDFINSELIPLISRHSVYKDNTQKELITNFDGFYEAILQENSGRIELHIFRSQQREIRRQVWDYTYGVDQNSQVIEMTNKINYDWIVNGLVIRVPLVGEYMLESDAHIQNELETLLADYKDDIIDLFKANNIVLPELKGIPTKFQFYEADQLEYRTQKEIIEDKLKEIVNVFNTMELTVVGNPHIMATDIINLLSVNKDGLETIQTGQWRITRINEVIGLGGFQTKLTLVRETDFRPGKSKSNVVIDKEPKRDPSIQIEQIGK